MKASKKKARAKHARALAPKSPPLKLKAAAHLLPPPPPPPHVDVTGIEGPMRANVAAAQRALGYAFHDPRLLEEALTHSSAISSRASYQRLEFVGDAALSLAITKHLYLENPGLGPGELSSLRAANVSTEKLARAAVWHGLYRFVRRNAEEMDQLVEEFSRDVMREDNVVGGLSYGGSSRKAPKVLADVIESVAAAVYIDSRFDLEILWMVFRRILAPIITEETLDEQPVTSLYEHCQKHGKTVQFKNYCSKGERNMVNIMKVFVDGELVGSGSSEQKHVAKLNAARDALHRLWSSDDDDDEPEESEEEEEEPCVLLPASAIEEGGAKKRLNELCSKSHWAKPEYRIVKEQGPPHDKRFSCLVEVKTSNGNVEAVGDSKPRIKAAENDAASRVLSKLCK